MNDVISTPPAPASPEGAMVSAGDWWPQIDVNAFRDELNLGGTTIPHARVKNALQNAMGAVLTALTDWHAEQIEAGHVSLALAAPAPVVNDLPVKSHAFIRAVHMYAAADLADKHPDLTATREGSDRGEQRRDMAADFRRDAIHAIRDITGTTRGDVELI